MRAIALFFFFAASHFCFAGGDTNILALSGWSKPVSTRDGQSLRARMMIAQEMLPGRVGNVPETEFYLELQNVTGAAGAPMQIYFDRRNLQCVMLDANGRPPPPPPGGEGGSGSGAGKCWITLPYDCTIRLRANRYGFGFPRGDGLFLMLTPGAFWVIQPGDTNDYYLSGQFTVTPPTNSVPADFDHARVFWSGTLELPKMKISVPKSN
jgi:hypothetical protein